MYPISFYMGYDKTRKQLQKDRGEGGGQREREAEGEKEKIKKTYRKRLKAELLQKRLA